MGFPMTYSRVMGRNGLHGRYCHTEDRNDHADPPTRTVRALLGDLRRLEADARHPVMLAERAHRLGIDEGSIKAIFDDFFGEFHGDVPCWCEPLNTCPAKGATCRCHVHVGVP